MVDATITYNNVLIVEDHPLYRDALVLLLQEAIENTEVITATSAEEGLNIVATFPKLHLILLDLNLPGLNGAEAVAAFRRSCPMAMIIVLSSSEDRRDVTAVLNAGARVFILKNAAHSLIVNTVRRALAGDVEKPEWVRASHASVFTEEMALPLNQRQIQILPLLARGCSNREIAMQVDLSEVTVKQYITTIFRVLGVENRAQALLAIRRFGLAAVE